jgi:hypothetical protein
LKERISKKESKKRAIKANLEKRVLKIKQKRVEKNWFLKLRHLNPLLSRPLFSFFDIKNR